MGNSLSLVPLDEDPDLAAIRRILAAAHLSPTAGTALLGVSDGKLPILGGEELAFEASWLGVGATSFYGQVYNTALTPEQCALFYELATAGNLLITPDFGPPHLVVCGRTHAAEDVHDESAPPWLEIVCFVESAAELHRALNGDWLPFRSEFLDSGTIWGPREQWPEEDNPLV